MSEGQIKGITRTKVAGHSKTQDQVRVLYGVHALEANLVGRAVADVRQALRQALNISPQAVAVVDGREVGEGFILLAGQQLEFVRLAGEKGLSLYVAVNLIPGHLGYHGRCLQAEGGSGCRKRAGSGRTNHNAFSAWFWARKAFVFADSYLR